MDVTGTSQQLTVSEGADPAVSLESSNNAGALVLRGEELDALSDNPDDLQADLQALAGPSAGPSGGSLFIDGFTGGEIPPKQSIREVRVNQDPFSAEYDKLGYGRIEIFTKPGSGAYHGTVDYNLGTDVWNARNPYSGRKAPLLLNEFEGGAGGPLNRRASFTLDAQRNTVDNGSIVNAVTLDPGTLAVQPFSDVFKTLQRYTRATPRIDYQLSDKQTLSLRYGFTHGDIDGAGIGSFDLLSRGYRTTFTNQTVQVTETAVLGSAVNDIRFQYYRNANRMIASSLSPVIQVLGSFTGGGSQLGHSADAQDSFELQDYASAIHGAHNWRFGTRIRAQQDASVSPVDFNGTYTFSGGAAPVLDASYQPAGVAMQPITSIERYRRTLLLERLGDSPAQIRAAGGGASQFSISQGRPDLAVSQIDLAFFAGDTWRLRPNLTLAYGLRYETQTNMHDWKDLAPRISVAWSPRSAVENRMTVIRAGLGVFYDRFALANTLTAERFNGIVQQQYVISNPDTFPNLPSPAELAASRTPQITDQLAADLRAPSILQAALTLERQLRKGTTLAVTYTNSRGTHLLRSRDVNAPLPASRLLPDGAGTGPVFLIESSGIYNQNQLIANVNTKLGSSLSLFGFYVLNRARSNTDGVSTAPANPYNFRGEYGPAATDIRNRFTLGGSIQARWHIRLSPFVILQSGAPFNITSGNDLFGTSLFNARPGFASGATQPGLVATRYGLLDPNPAPGEQIVPRNYGRGPAQFTVNLRLSKTIGFGRERDGAGPAPAPSLSAGQRVSVATSGQGLGRLMGSSSTPRRYNLILSLSARNLLNHLNPGPIIGDITSPLFGRANQIAGGPNGEGFSENASNRRLEMQVRLQF